MADLTGTNQVFLCWMDGECDRAALYAIRNTTTGDTVNVSDKFTRVRQAVMLGTTVVGSAVATVSGTVVTMPAGLSGDAAYLLIWGCSA